MKTANEIYATLQDQRRVLEDITDGTEDIHLGWIEALEFVLDGYKPLVVSDVILDKLNQEARKLEREHFLNAISGGFAYAEVVNEGYDSEDDRHYYVFGIKYGVLNDCEDRVTTIYGQIYEDNLAVVWDPAL